MSKAHKTQILSAMRATFPSILPARLQEARQAILSYMGVERGYFGIYPSGGYKFDLLCSQAVTELKRSGEMSTEGWTWFWEGSHSTSTPAATPTINMSFEDFLEDSEEIEETPHLYDVTCEATLDFLISETSCFGGAVKSDPECQGCPLVTACLERKAEKKAEAQERKSLKEEALEALQEAGFSIDNLKLPRSVNLSEAQSLKALSEVPCVVTQEMIKAGEGAVHIEGWGWVKELVYEALGALQS